MFISLLTSLFFVAAVAVSATKLKEGFQFLHTHTHKRCPYLFVFYEHCSIMEGYAEVKPLSAYASYKVNDSFQYSYIGTLSGKTACNILMVEAKEDENDMR